MNPYGTNSRKGKPNKSRQEVIQLIEEIAEEKYGEGGKKFAFSKLFELADGVTVLEKINEVDVIYTKEPNVKALQTLVEYRWGKAPQTLDVTTDGESLNDVIGFDVNKLKPDDVVMLSNMMKKYVMQVDTDPKNGIQSSQDSSGEAITGQEVAK